MIGTPEQKFLLYVDKNGPELRPGLGKCWLWTGGLTSCGYGVIRHAGRRILAHRFSWLRTHGSYPKPFACHHCDNPPCVNPAHLFEGTHADNMRDKVSKGRNVNLRGPSHGCAKLTAEEVLLIKARVAAGDSSQWAIARAFNVTQSTVSRIVRGRGWHRQARRVVSDA